MLDEIKRLMEEATDKDRDFYDRARPALLFTCVYGPGLVAVAEAAEKYIDEVDSGIISGTYDRREHLLGNIRAALSRFEGGKTDGQGNCVSSSQKRDQI